MLLSDHNLKRIICLFGIYDAMWLGNIPFVYLLLYHIEIICSKTTKINKIGCASRMPLRPRKIKPRNRQPRQPKVKPRELQMPLPGKKCGGFTALCGCCRLNYFTPMALSNDLNSKRAHKLQTSTTTKLFSSSPTNSIRPLSFSVSPISVSVSVGPFSFTFSQPVSSSVNTTPLPIRSGMEGSRTVTPGPQYVQSNLCQSRELFSSSLLHQNFSPIHVSISIAVVPSDPIPFTYDSSSNILFPFRMHCPGDFAYLLYLSTAHSFNLLTTEQQQIFSATGASFQAQLAAN